MRQLLVLALPCLLCAQTAAPLPTAERLKQGHSLHGEAFDTGPRTRPAAMSDIGRSHFPITRKNPEVQQWFDQGNTLLHSFWDYEAERAFRWALKLEPDNAMVYWGLARASSGSRSAEFLKEAVKRKDSVTERERLYIEALAARDLRDPLRDRGDDYRIRDGEYRKILETIAVKYPDDVEAKALLALANMGESRYGTEQIIREVLAREPDHPGAHHYRIHNWNYHEPEQALESCKRFGEIAPGVGHALHMPGHVYATVGMWHEAAIAMDAATRVEVRRMHERQVFPFNYWNYGHNRAYLSYIQEQLGMAGAAISGAQELIEAPLDPKFNGDLPYSSHSQGLNSLLRACIKYERWNELLDTRSFPWRDLPGDKMNKAYAETRAHVGLGHLSDAEKSLAAHSALKGEADKNKSLEGWFHLQQAELKARMALSRGETIEGLAQLTTAARMQFDMQKSDNDPPRYPELLYNALGRAYLAAKSPALARECFDKSLTLVRNDIFALAGLVEAWHALGDDEKARPLMARLLFTASNADKGLNLIERAMATGVKARAKDSSPAPQRNYAGARLDSYGPASWTPFEAPKLDALDPENKAVSLDDFKGKNVVLVFYLGRECLHCMKQLRDIAARKSDWDRLDTVVLAVSPNTPEENARGLKTAPVEGVRLLSDQDFANARRFQSYDDFEEIEVHSTILIDKTGKVNWGHTGGDPFGDIGFLVKQVERMNGKGA